MIRVEIPYKNHINKSIWDYMTQACGQLNNINRATDLSEPEASVENILYLVFHKIKGIMRVKILVSLSDLTQSPDGNKYQPYCDIWAPLCDCITDYDTDIQIFSFDIKKYNSVLSFSENYQNRDKIVFYIDEDNKTLNYKLYNDEYVLLSPIYISKTATKEISDSLFKCIKSVKLKSDDYKYMSVDSVDKNSYLLPFMAYKDFLNFAVHSSDSELYVASDSIISELVQGENKDIKFYLKTKLREDKFHITSTFFASPALWQILVMLQSYKAWQKLDVYRSEWEGKITSYASLIFDTDNEGNVISIEHLFRDRPIEDTYKFYTPDYSTYQLVGKLHSDELHRLNKLYSNANRTCYFDFSTQTFSGNNYAFNENKLEVKTVKLENDLSEQVNLPLRITFTEIKHYVGSDLSQKNFILKIYTDGIRVMIERINAETDKTECIVIFNHEMSKKNQKLSI